jgi:hypothetical protein
MMMNEAQNHFNSRAISSNVHDWLLLAPTTATFMLHFS